MLSVERPRYLPGEATPLFTATLRKKAIEWGKNKVADIPLSFSAFPYSDEQIELRSKNENEVKGLEGYMEWFPFGISPHTNVHVGVTFFHRKLARQSITYNEASRESYIDHPLPPEADDVFRHIVS